MSKVSVVIPTYNYARFAVEAVESVLNQTFQDVEVIVVDDGSTDDTRALIAPFGPAVRYFYQERRGLPAARNVGIKSSRGDFVAFLDADDLWLPEKLERQLQVFRTNRSAGLVYAGVLEVDSGGNILKVVKPRTRGRVFPAILTGNIVTGSATTAIVRRECLKDVGLFDEGLNACEDWDLWIRIAKCYEFDYVDLPLVKYRLHSSNMHRDIERMKLSELAVLEKAFADPDLPVEIKRLKPLAYSRIYAGTGLARFCREEYESARADFIQALRLNPQLLLNGQVALCFFSTLLGRSFVTKIRSYKRKVLSVLSGLIAQ